MKRMFPHFNILIIPLFFFTNSSVAQDSNFYMGVGAGQTSADFTQPKIAYLDYDPFTVMTGPSGPAQNVASELASTSADDTASGYEFFLGYQMNRHFALEFAYNDFGTFSAETHTDEIVSSPAQPDSFTRDRAVSSTSESKGVTLTLLGTRPLNDRFQLIGLAGVMHAETAMAQYTQTSASNSGMGMGEDHYTDKRTSVFAGVGLGMSLNDSVDMRFLVRYFPDAYEQGYGNRDSSGEPVNNGNVDLQQASLNLLYRF